MKTTKNITYTIYWLGLFAVMLFDIKNFPLYFVIAGILIQIVIIISVYRMNNRTLSGERMLVIENYKFKLKEIILSGLVFLLYLFLVSVIFLKSLPGLYMLVYLSVNVVSLIIQFLIERKKKNTPAFIIGNNHLYMNDLFVKTYDLGQLAGIGFDGFTEVYIMRFAGNKKVHIKRKDFSQEDLDRFFSLAISKCIHDVEISESISNEISAAVNRQVSPA